jgi:hypothetical protein
LTSSATNPVRQTAGTDDHRRLGLSNLRPAGIVLALYQLAFGGALHVVLRGDLGDAALCFGPIVIVAALAMTSQADRKQYIARWRRRSFCRSGASSGRARVLRRAGCSSC